MVFRQWLSYTVVLVIPALIGVSGCGGDPPKPPVEIEDVQVDDLKAGVQGIELGAEGASPTDVEGEPTDSAEDRDVSKAE